MKNKINWDNAIYDPDVHDYFRIENDIPEVVYKYIIYYVYDRGWLTFSLSLHSIGCYSINVDIDLCEDKIILIDVQSIEKAKQLVEEHYNTFIKYFCGDN